MSTPTDKSIDALVCEFVFDVPYTLVHYATSISAAWFVVDRMRERGFSLALVCEPENCDASFYPARGPIPMCGAIDKEPPRAICLAALRALGVEVTASGEIPSTC